jgi:hypothetical protein
MTSEEDEGYFAGLASSEDSEFKYKINVLNIC